MSGGRPPRPEGRGFHAPGWLRCGPCGATSFPPRPEGRGFSEDLDDAKSSILPSALSTCPCHSDHFRRSIFSRISLPNTAWHWFRLMSDPHEQFCWTSRWCRVMLLRRAPSLLSGRDDDDIDPHAMPLL